MSEEPFLTTRASKGKIFGSLDNKIKMDGLTAAIDKLQFLKLAPELSEPEKIFLGNINDDLRKEYRSNVYDVLNDPSNNFQRTLDHCIRTAEKALAIQATNEQQNKLITVLPTMHRGCI